MEHTRISHYEIGRRLGRGGMGEVYEATDLHLDRRVALKFVAPEMAADGEALKRFEREARSAAALHHPHIATLFAFEHDGARTFIAMELVGGESLRERIRRGPLPIAEALAIARDVAGALALAHRRGIAHRDVKPENLMFDEDGRIKLMDFGLARAAQASRITMTGSTLGTAAYMAPESTRGTTTGPPADVFALGVVLHEMLTGELPFAGDSPLALMFVIANEAPKPVRATRPEVSEEVAALIARMLDKEPDTRPDAPTIARELALLTGAPPPPTDTLELEATRVPPDEDALTLAPTVQMTRARRGSRFGLWISLGGAVVVIVFVLLNFGGPIMYGLGFAGFSALRDFGGKHSRAVELNNQGYDLLFKDSLEAARSRFDAALVADPRYSEAMLNLAFTLRKSGDLTRAAALYGRVIREHPEDQTLVARAHDGLAEIDMRSSALPSAIGHLERALALDSTAVIYPNNLAYALLRSGRSRDAIEVVERAIVRFPGQASLYKNLGLGRLQLGDLDGALAALDTALEKDPSLSSALGVRAQVKARRRDLAGARADWSAYLAMEHDEDERPGIEAELARLGVKLDAQGSTPPQTPTPPKQPR